MSLLNSTRLAMLAAILLATGGQRAAAQPIRGAGHETAHLGTGKEASKDRSNNKGKIEGTKWSSDELTVKDQLIPAGSIRFEFTADGKVTYWILKDPYTGRYTLGPGDTVIMDLDKELSGSKRHVQKIIIKANKLTLVDTDGTSVIFTKSK